MNLIAAFSTRAPLLVFDEPTAGLDPLMEREFRRCVAEARRHGQTIFLSSHQLAEVEAVCDKVGILRAGHLAGVDTIADLRQLRRTVVEVSYRGIRPELNGVAAMFVFPITLGWFAIGAARRRDVGGALVTVRTSRPPRVQLLGSLGGFAIRRALRPTTAWAIGIGVCFFIVGAMTASVLELFEQNRCFADLAAAAGFAGLDSANRFAAALFSLLAIPTGLYAATRLATMVADEKARRWTPIFTALFPRPG